MSAPTTPTARRSCCAPRRRASRRRQLIARVHGEHTRDFAGFHVAFDNYYSTHSDETRFYAEDIYAQAQGRRPDRGARHRAVLRPGQADVPARPLHQGRMPEVRREGPVRRHLRSLRRRLCAHRAEESATRRSPAPRRCCKSSDHYFFKLSDPRCQSFLRAVDARGGSLQPEAANKLQEWLGEPGENKLTDWDISRDAPYFGFEIPDAPGKYFYVWLDAPIGYMGSFKNLCDRAGPRLRRLLGQGLARPSSTTSSARTSSTSTPCSGRPSWSTPATARRPASSPMASSPSTAQRCRKSRGTFITAESYLKQGLNPEWLRYYFAAKLNGTMEDIDLNLDDFVAG